MKNGACFEHFWGYDFANPALVTARGGSRRKSKNDRTPLVVPLFQ
jgi:hypothetical protein